MPLVEIGAMQLDLGGNLDHCEHKNRWGKRQ